MVFNKGAKTIQQGKDGLLINDVGKLDTHVQKHKVGPSPYTIYKY